MDAQTLNQKESIQMVGAAYPLVHLCRFAPVRASIVSLSSCFISPVFNSLSVFSLLCSLGFFSLLRKYFFFSNKNKRWACWNLRVDNDDTDNWPKEQKYSYLLVPQTKLPCIVTLRRCRFVGGLDIKKAESYYYLLIQSFIFPYIYLVCLGWMVGTSCLLQRSCFTSNSSP